MNRSDSVRKVKGVGPKMEEKLGLLGIRTVEDLISFYPRAYQDWSDIRPMDEVRLGEEQAIYGRIVDVKEVFPRAHMSILTVVVTDSRNAVNLVYFNQSWKKAAFPLGAWVLVYGRVEYAYHKWQMSSPDTELIEPDQLAGMKKLIPVYSLTEGVRMNQMRQMIDFALAHVEAVPENLPSAVAERCCLMNRQKAVETMHHPAGWAEQKAARHRLAFEELFFMQAGILLLRRKRMLQAGGIKCAPSGALVRQVMERFPFQLTPGQKQAFADIEDDMEGMIPMQRLIQGDVGSGKTAVAALALAKITENGYQGALMAPTEVLAVQHYKTFTDLYEGLPIRCALLTGQTKSSEKRQILENLREGCIQVLIGTHALIEDAVVFHSLGLVITDEQHRFGVRQRQALEVKGEAPHVLIMTATPIPRTMALSVYGDLDVSAIRGLPPGRKPVKTYAIGRSMVERVYRFMEKEMTAGRQIYVVCPLVEKSEKQDLKAAVSVYEHLKQTIFPRFSCGLIHGRMKSKEKEQIMTDFQKGRIQLLTATSVIEVGVNVPNASIMFVYGADRFGLSQLHQLRGRVGRGKEQAYCILYSDNTNETTRLRLELMTKIQDGFLLAEKDLLLRGAGEFFGYHQHGLPDLKAAHIISDLPILEEARREAARAIGEGLDARDELSRRFGGALFQRIYGESAGGLESRGSVVS